MNLHGTTRVPIGRITDKHVTSVMIIDKMKDADDGNIYIYTLNCYNTILKTNKLYKYISNSYTK